MSNSDCVECVETDIRKALQMTCPVCNNLFQAKSELCDRRPLVACANGDTVCADCCKRPDGKCPPCGDDLLKTSIVNKKLMELIEKCASLLEIPVKELEMDTESFARGAFGEVYKGKWRKGEVVVKVITTYSEKDKEAVRCEANLTLRLNHPNVIHLFGITYVKSRQVGMVMESAEQLSLDTWIGKMDGETLTKIALGIVDGLEYVHSQKVIHRDIKPKNILMFGPKEDMVPKIADFGVSKVIETVMMTHSRVGQDLYMAPEVRVNLRYNFTADIFSLAMMLFEMFNEQLITYASDEVKRFVLALQTESVGRIPNSCKVPVHLRDVIERGWSKNPDQRPTLSDYRSTLHGKCLFLLNIQPTLCRQVNERYSDIPLCDITTSNLIFTSLH